MNRYCFAVDLKDDSKLIEEYEAYHTVVWPEVLQSIRESGIKTMEVYRTGTRLFMILEADEEIVRGSKFQFNLNNPVLMKWEDLLWKYQKALPHAPPGQKWVEMDKVFDLNATGHINR